MANIFDPDAAPHVVRLTSRDWSTRCCKKCARDHKVCAITAAAAERAGIRLEDLVDPSGKHCLYFYALIVEIPK